MTRTWGPRSGGPHQRASPVTPASDIARLIADLRDGDALARESASARLRVLGTRALTRLATLVREDRNPSVRVAALATIGGDRLHLRVAVGGRDGEPPVVRAESDGPRSDTSAPVEGVMARLEKLGATRLLHGR